MDVRNPVDILAKRLSAIYEKDRSFAAKSGKPGLFDFVINSTQRDGSPAPVAVHDSTLSEDDSDTGMHWVDFAGFSIYPRISTRDSIRGPIETVIWVLVAFVERGGTRLDPPNVEDVEHAVCNSADEVMIAIVEYHYGNWLMALVESVDADDIKESYSIP